MRHQVHRKPTCFQDACKGAALHLVTYLISTSVRTKWKDLIVKMGWINYSDRTFQDSFVTSQLSHSPVSIISVLEKCILSHCDFFSLKFPSVLIPPQSYHNYFLFNIYCTPTKCQASGPLTCTLVVNRHDPSPQNI